MLKEDFGGVLPALTTKMDAGGEVDFEAVRADVEFHIGAGVDGVIMCGSLGEASTLTSAEKLSIATEAVTQARGRVPVILTVAEDSTRAALALIEQAEATGVDGLMVLPAMRYLSDRRETLTYFRAVAGSTGLPIIVYNNPVAYGIDITADMFAELAALSNLVAIKESSGQTRRVTDLINAVGDRFRILTGVDDVAMESLVLGCHGWIAGLCGAFPAETVAIFRLVSEARLEEAREVYRWFMPLLHLDTEIKFVQNIKLCEAVVRGTSPAVRPPRLPLEGTEERTVRELVEAALASRPDLGRFELKRRA